MAKYVKNVQTEFYRKLLAPGMIFIEYYVFSIGPMAYI